MSDPITWKDTDKFLKLFERMVVALEKIASSGEEKI